MFQIFAKEKTNINLIHLLYAIVVIWIGHLTLTQAIQDGVLFRKLEAGEAYQGKLVAVSSKRELTALTCNLRSVIKRILLK